MSATERERREEILRQAALQFRRRTYTRSGRRAASLRAAAALQRAAMSSQRGTATR